MNQNPPTDQIPITRELLGSMLENPWFCETLFDHTEDIVFFVKDKKARYVVVNDTLVARCGVASKADVIGKTTMEVFPDPLGDFFFKQDQKVLEKGTAIYGRLELHLYGDASKGWCLTDKIPLYGPDKAVIGLTGISRDLHNPGETQAGYSQVADAIDFLRTHYMDNLRIRDLAQQVGLSLSRFERLVSKIYGLNPNQLLIKARIDAASQLLATGNKSIAEIAYSCGYADHSAFTRQFRSAVGVTPSQFRSAQRKRTISTLPGK